MKLFISHILYVVFSCYVAYSQTNISTKSLKLFFVEKQFENTVFYAKNQPSYYPMLNDYSFSENHLKTPYTVLQSLLVATSTNWIDSLTEIKGRSRLSEEMIKKRKEKTYRDNCKLKIISELSFQYNRIDFIILLTEFIGLQKKDNFLNPFVLKHTESGWKIYSGELSELAGMLYLKPEVFEQIVQNKASHKLETEQFQSEYFNDNRFNLSATKGLRACFLYKKSLCYPSLMIDIENYQPPKKDISFKVVDFGVIKRWSNNEGLIRKFPNSGNPENHIWGGCVENIYNQSPEFALASWIFETNLSEKKKYVTSVENFERKFKSTMVTPTSESLKMWLIGINYSIEFYAKKERHCLIFFDEWQDTKTSYKKSILLIFKNENWVVVTDNYTDNLAVQLSRMLDILHYEALDAFLLDIKSGNNEINSFIKKVKDSEGRIYVNSLPEKFAKYCTPSIGNPFVEKDWTKELR